MTKIIPQQVGLNHDTRLLNEESTIGACGVDFENIDSNFKIKTGQKTRESIGLPQLTEPQVLRHFIRLSRQNYSIDQGFYPLGSCTMKHNPRINEKLARLDGFANTHPLQNENSVQGNLQLMYELQEWLIELSGLHAVALSPAAGAHGELAGISVIRAYHNSRGNPRSIILIPDSAHGTNPATAAICEYDIKVIPSTKEGLVDFDHFQKLVAEYGNEIAGIMLTNPSTTGRFEPNIKKIADIIHNIGGLFYCDGANFNAIVGKIKPKDCGIDVMHFNLHKTFSTPHGGGGPGCGPIAVTKDLQPFLPAPIVEKSNDQYFFKIPDKSIGKIKGFHGQFGMMVRALAYMKSHGADGCKKVAEDAVLSANYIMAKLQKYYHVPFKGSCMHECLLSDKFQKEKNVSTLDIAKMLIEYGMHPMTTFFPLIVSGAMLIEPTETETKEFIDDFIDIMIYIAKKINDNDNLQHIKEFPLSTPRRRPDEVLAAKNPILTWQEL